MGDGSTLNVASDIYDELMYFFKENPREVIELDFGNIERLSWQFAKELFKKNIVYRYNIKICGMHAHDQMTMTYIR